MGDLIEYKVVREYMNGRRGKRKKSLCRWSDDPQGKLKIGGLYVHLGHGFPGMQRVLSAEITKSYFDD